MSASIISAECEISKISFITVSYSYKDILPKKCQQKNKDGHIWLYGWITIELSDEDHEGRVLIECSEGEVRKKSKNSMIFSIQLFFNLFFSF